MEGEGRGEDKGGGDASATANKLNISSLGVRKREDRWLMEATNEIKT